MRQGTGSRRPSRGSAYEADRAPVTPPCRKDMDLPHRGTERPGPGPAPRYHPAPTPEPAEPRPPFAPSGSRHGHAPRYDPVRTREPVEQLAPLSPSES